MAGRMGRQIVNRSSGAKSSARAMASSSSSGSRLAAYRARWLSVPRFASASRSSSDGFDTWTSEERAQQCAAVGEVGDVDDHQLLAADDGGDGREFGDHGRTYSLGTQTAVHPGT